MISRIVISEVMTRVGRACVLDLTGLTISLEQSSGLQNAPEMLEKGMRPLVAAVHPVAVQ